MASNSDWGPFLSYWGHYCKDTVSQLISGADQNEFKYSEGMLTTLCYETDVGCIPRGIKLGSGVTTPKYGNTENWDKQIEGCYWCVADDSNWNGICCSKDCFFYLHDWCIERVEHFTQRRFCRLPWCDKSAVKGGRYCNGKHRAKFDAAFAKGTDYESLSRTVIRAGPSWYSSSGNSQSLIQHNKDKSNKNSPNRKNTQQKANTNQAKDVSPVVAYDMKFPIDLQNAMIFKTDIGLIPRTPPDERHLASPYSSSPNWLREINGCVRCGNKSMTQTGNSNFCTFRCYLLFYEWCRRLVESLTGISLCKDTGCNRLAAEGFGCCSKEHTIALEEKYSQIKHGDFERLIVLGPNWYKKYDFNKDLTQFPPAQTLEKISSQPVPQQQHMHSSPSFPPSMIFSWQLTQVLFYSTDVGAIPRGISQFMSPAPALTQIHNVNWNAPINLCYWCCTKPIQLNISCSKRCFYQLNEWIHNKYTQVTHNRSCKVLRCESSSAKGFDCCNRSHSIEYDKFKEFSPLLKSTEFALGPSWYQDFSAQHIDFYNRGEPFYELTNFYACNNLVIDGISWPTTEHYFQANKFAGTPYLLYISFLHAPRDAFDFSRKPGVQCWIRSNWPTIKINVMLKALRHKFAQNQDLAEILTRTGSKHIFEHTKNDKFWGDGGDNRNGTNKLGELLMVVRRELQSGCLITMTNNTMHNFQMNNYISSPQLIHDVPHINETQYNSPTKVAQTNNQLDNCNQIVDSSSRSSDGNEASLQSQQTNFGGNTQTPVNPSSPKEINSKSLPHEFKANLFIDPKFPNAIKDVATNPPPLFIPGEGKDPLPEDYQSPFNITFCHPEQQTELPSSANFSTSDNQSHEPSIFNNNNPFLDVLPTKLSVPDGNGTNPFLIPEISVHNESTTLSPTCVSHENNPMMQNMATTPTNGPTIPPLVDLTPQVSVPDNTVADSLSSINFNLAHVKSQGEQAVKSPTKLPESNDDTKNKEDCMDTDY